MSKYESKFFRLVDERARLLHGCFLAEFFPVPDKDMHYLCFRPLAKKGETKWDVKYLTVETPDVEADGKAGRLSHAVLATMESLLF
jgi:hypothetical protein